MSADNSSQFPYQACLMPNLPEETQLQIRDLTNHVAIPLNMLVAAMSFVCNGLVIMTVARTKSLHQPPLLMLCSLAMTDVLYSQYSFFRFIELLAHDHMCPDRASEEIATLAALCLLATLGNLAIISRDRYLAVRKPWWYRTHVTKSRAMKMICVPWLTSAVISFIMYLSRKFEGRFPPLGQVMSLLFCFICFSVITFYYLSLFCRKPSPEEVLLVRAVLEREKRTANTVALILLVLLVTFLPGLPFPLVLNAIGVSNFQPFRPLYGILLQLNGLLNPLLNFGRSKEMRTALRKFFKCSQKVQPLSTTSAPRQQPVTTQVTNSSSSTTTPTPAKQ